MSYKFKYGTKTIEVPQKSDITWNNVLNKPSTFNPMNHNHGYATWIGKQFMSGGEYIGFYNNVGGGKRKGWVGHDDSLTFYIRNEVSGGAVELSVNTGHSIFLAHNGSYPYVATNIDNSTYLGVSWSRWKQLFASTGTISTSDETKKKNISLLNEKYYQLAEKIDIVSFQFKETEQIDKVSRIHIGVISQRVEKAIEEVGLTAKDFAGFCKDQKYLVSQDQNGNEIKEEIKGEYDYSLRYDELAMLKIWYLEEMVKRQQKQIDFIKEEFKLLKNNK